MVEQKINTRYADVHDGFGYGSKNTDRSTVLKFTNNLSLVICNTCFMKQDSNLVCYESGPSKSTIDYRYAVVRNQHKPKPYLDLEGCLGCSNTNQKTK